MTIWNQHWECERCSWVGHEDDLRSECVFHGTREEPPEYEAYCPDCGENWDMMREVQLVECPACTEICLPDVGGECLDCKTITEFSNITTGAVK